MAHGACMDSMGRGKPMAHDTRAEVRGMPTVAHNALCQDSEGAVSLWPTKSVSVVCYLRWPTTLVADSWQATCWPIMSEMRLVVSH